MFAEEYCCGEEYDPIMHNATVVGHEGQHLSADTTVYTEGECCEQEFTKWSSMGHFVTAIFLLYVLHYFAPVLPLA